MAKKILTYTFLAIMIFFLNAAPVQPGVFAQPLPADNGVFGHITHILKDVKPGDLSFCLGYIKNSKHTTNDIANFILTWSPKAYAKKIPTVFRSKIDRVVTKLASIDYQRLLIDIDVIKNSQLTIDEMVRLINGTQLGKKR